jgi:hypothetical protein
MDGLLGPNANARVQMPRARAAFFSSAVQLTIVTGCNRATVSCWRSSGRLRWQRPASDARSERTEIVCPAGRRVRGGRSRRAKSDFQRGDSGSRFPIVHFGATLRQALGEEIKTSVRIEPGVLTLNAVPVKGKPSQIRILFSFCSPTEKRSSCAQVSVHLASVLLPEFLTPKNGGDGKPTVLCLAYLPLPVPCRADACPAGGLVFRW